MGMVYKRGKVWWVKYYQHGKMFRETSGSTLKGDAEDLLKTREGKMAEGTFVGLKPEKTTFDDLATDFLNAYKIDQKAALEMAEYYAERLRKHFGGMRAVAITTDRIRAFIAERKEEKTQLGKTPANATINRELSALKRMFNLGKQAGKVVVVPHIPMLKENNVRKGFFHHRDYLRLKKALPADLRPMIALAYYTGMRRGEIVSLKWSQVDFQARTIHLDPGTTKNLEARSVPMSQEVFDELQAQRAIQRHALSRSVRTSSSGMATGKRSRTSGEHGKPSAPH